MIQRIQTLYLLAATALMTIFFFSPLASCASSEGVFSLTVFGVKSFDGADALNIPYLAIIAALTTLLPLVNIFFFKKRMLQLRLCIVQIILAVGTLIVAGIYYYLANRFFASQVGDLSTSSLRIVCALPIFAIVFDYLALKAIFKDEMLIKSLDRIR